MDVKRKKRIFFIEDDPDHIMIYQMAFIRSGYSFLFAHSGEEGLRLVKDAHPDLILLDIVMYGMDGLEVLQRLKTDSQTKAIPVAILSNVTKKAMLDKCLKLGAVACYFKAKLTPKELVQAVSGLVK